ncbi:MAG: universal stress protein [Halodesulfurarchaeum sp.]|nr:universal stress protein [Halodesulfurarchaeum sp.]
MPPGQRHTASRTPSGTPNTGPIRLILDATESREVHAVVMGTGRRRSDRPLLGRVAVKTVRAAPVPAITAGRGE